MDELRVADCMHRGVISCAPDTSLAEVAATMGSRDISAIVVMEGSTAVGLISQTDLVNAAFVQPYMRFWRGLTARHLMSTPVIAVTPDTPLADAVGLMRARRIHRLVVVAPGEDNRPIGILSLTDVVRRLGQQVGEATERAR